MHGTTIVRAAGLALCGALAVAPASAHAQAVGGFGWGETTVNSEGERYLRMLQVAGSAIPYPWSIRSFSPREVERLASGDSLHPWAARPASIFVQGGALHWHVIAPNLDGWFNSGFPYGYNEGPVWIGRGLTGAIRTGVAARYGPLSLVVAPYFFAVQNASFQLLHEAFEGGPPYGNGRSPDLIDLPERFGDEPYARIDPGQSTIRLDLPVFSVGISTANQHWGPAREYPILLGNNAPGFVHGFIGSSAPLNIGVGRVHGRLVAGRLEQSAHSPVTGAGSQRLMTGMVGVFTPRGLPGLEIGGGRFFHEPWPEGGLEVQDLLKPLEGFWKAGLPDRGLLPEDPASDVDNQLVSLFFRWVLPRSGFEVYGEFGREDHSWDLRDFLLEPDHSGGYMLGLQKVWTRSPTKWVSLRGEVLNLQVGHIAQVRNQWPFYVHGWTRQGHTHRGQLLGAAAGYGGAGAILAADLYHARGRWTASWARAVRQDRGDDWGVEARDARALDVKHALGLEGFVFLGRVDVTGGLTGVYNFNRNYTSDAVNLQARAGLRVAW